MRNVPYHPHTLEQPPTLRFRRVSWMVSAGWIVLALVTVAVNAVGQEADNSPTTHVPKRSWGPEQAIGAPDTPRADDLDTAWASINPDGRIEWLWTDFERAANIAEVRIRESFNPGAVSKVTAILESGEERVLWEGQDPTSKAPADLVVHVDGDVVSKSVKIYIDTSLKLGWNEIDAVELVAKDGTRQWASQASASSTYAEYMLDVPTRPQPAATTVTDNKLAFEMPGLDGILVSSKDKRFKNKVVLVDIWGSWCGPCRAEIPHLVRLYEAYRDQGLEIVGLSFEKGPTRESNIKTLVAFAEEYNMDYPILYGGPTSDVNKQVPAVENFVGFPTAILIGRDGKVSSVTVGFSSDEMSELEKSIQELLGK